VLVENTIPDGDNNSDIYTVFEPLFGFGSPNKPETVKPNNKTESYSLDDVVWGLWR
jgi:hypothetical protein